jgi:N-acetylmuramoyl-L-alanine amidase
MGMRRSNEKLSAAKRENEVISLEDNYQQHYAGYDPRSPESTLIFEVINETNMALSVELAQLIQRYTCATARRPNKGVRQDAFLVLRETSMPACLVELGYITTVSEKNYLTKASNVDLMGRGIYQAFVAFKKAHDGKGAVSVVEEPREDVAKEDVAPVVEQPAVVEEPVSPTEEQTVTNASDIVFKVQIMSSDVKMKKTDSRLKGQKDADCYREGRLWKYTVGSSTNYSEIYQLCKQLRKKFPEAFVIAFRDGEKMNIRKAIEEFKRTKNS